MNDECTLHKVQNVPECGFRSAKYFLFFTLRKQSYKDKRTEGVVAILVVAASLLSLVPPTPRLSLKFLTKKVFPLSPSLLSNWSATNKARSHSKKVKIEYARFQCSKGCKILGPLKYFL